MLRARHIPYLPLSNVFCNPVFQLAFVHWRACWQDFSCLWIARRSTYIYNLKYDVSSGLLSRRVADERSETRVTPYLFFTREMSSIPRGLYSSLQGKVILITGAGSGIGAGTAQEFAKNGSCLGLSGLSEKELQETADKCIGLGLSADQIKCNPGDLTNLDCCKETVEKVIAHFGKLDVLVNCAGVYAHNTIDKLTIKQYDFTMNLNCRAVVFLTHYAVPHLIKTKGTIVNVSSICGMRSYPTLITYCLSKAAIDQFTRCCALDLAPKGIRVNGVNPGHIDTGIHQRGGMSDDAYEKFLERGKKTHAMGRVGKVEEVCNAITFLCSDASSFVTAVTIPIDGGKHAMSPR